MILAGATKGQPRDDNRFSPIKAKALIDRKSGKTVLKFSDDAKDSHGNGAKTEPKTDTKKKKSKISSGIFL